MIAPATPRDGPDQRSDLLLEYLLLGDLLELLEEPVTPHTRAGILVVLDVVLDELSSIERTDGLSDVLDERPQWQREVDALRGDKVSHYLELAELRECLEEHAPIRRSTSQVICMLRGWMESLAALRSRENELVQMAANRDTGGEC